MNRKNSRRTGYRPGPPGGSIPRLAAASDAAPAATPPAAAAAPRPEPRPRELRKDQERALCAYAWAETAKAKGELDEYEIAVQSFAAALLRTGFAAAVSVLERNRERGAFGLLLAQLAGRALPGIGAAAPSIWPARVREVADIGHYMQATRELTLLLAWLRRACRALGA